VAAYLIVDITKIADEEMYASYRSRVSIGLKEAGGEYLVRGGAVQVLEGDWSPNRIVVVRFPSKDAAKQWWDSADYAELKQMRQAATLTNMILVPGFENEVE
jgi:uncharacterized protein (DUF1330 family)